MKNKGVMTLGLLAMLAGIGGTAGCAKKTFQTCVDRNGRAVADTYCRTGYAGGAYRWYYSGRYFSKGSRVNSGSYTTPPAGAKVVRSSQASRGVFGRLGGSKGGSAS